jgi:hypothetical protein
MQLNYILRDFILISFLFIQYLAFSTLAGEDEESRAFPLTIYLTDAGTTIYTLFCRPAIS